MITLEQAAELAGPVDNWPGNCHGIALKLIPGLPEGTVPQYGMYMGDIHPDSPFYPQRSVGTRHGWCRVGDRIVDPTRWVFDAGVPSIFITSVDDPDYDFGMKRLRSQFRQPCPPKSGKCPDIDWGDASAFVEQFTGETLPLSGSQACWLANEMPENLQPFVADIYAALTEAGFGAFIPIDFKQQMEHGL